MNKREQLIYYAIQYEGDYKKVLTAYLNHQKVDSFLFIPDAITILDKDYPEQLKDLQAPPLVLFYKGNKALLNKPCISVVGSRKPNQYATRIMATLVNQIKKKYVIVSGLASGIDALAHLYALDKGTIGVLGCGINYIYPKTNQCLFEEMSKNHLILSEYPFDTNPQKHYFPWRNRIISGLSNQLIVVQATLKSGTMHTVNWSIEMNRDIHVVPHPIDDQLGSGCNLLIQQGANILLTEDIPLL
ncbi:MAG: DNA-processing protein DprA [Erysipelotrichaceae bacterium]